MSSVEAVRLLADEHHLEFVDLERFNVDAGASSVIPLNVARRHHVVPIGRKFGAPVIAMSDPADVVAMDVLRAVIGREFVTVVASRDQIETCLIRVYGGIPEDPDAPRRPTSVPHTDAPGPTVPSNGSNGTTPIAERPVPARPVTPPPAPVQSRPNARPAEAPTPTPPSVAPPAAPPSKGSPAPPPSKGSPAQKAAPTARPAPPPAEQAKAAPQAAPARADTAPAQPAGRSSARAPEEPVVDQAPSPVEEATATTAAASVDDRAAESPDLVESSHEGTAASPSDSSVSAPEDAEDLLAAALDAIDSSLGPDVDDADTVDAQRDAHGLVLDDAALDSSSLEDTGATESVADVVRAADLVEEVVAEFEQQADVEAPSGGSGLASFPPLARVLVEGERVSLEDMEEVLDERDRTGEPIARILTLRGLVNEADLMWGMAQEMGLEFVDLDTHGVDVASAYQLPEATARHHNVLVIGMRDSALLVAASNPTDVFAMDDLRTIIGRNFVTVVATRSQINSYIDNAYNQGGDASEVANTAASDFEDIAGNEDLSNIQAIVDDAPIVRYVNLLILQALNERASDIHVEPAAENLRIRYRIDGVLHDISTAPRAISSAVSTRLKVMADMNIAEHRVPQDGRISLTVSNRPIDLRMATLPTIYGEKVVMRVLDKTNVVLGFEDLGFDADLLEIYQRVYTKPYGTILVTGPTGSGKTTTLYATLSALNVPEKNIITVEDPVELRIKGINQVQLNTKAGLTFASALRSILRSDPDIVLVGEIRDKETAMISVEAALTGHLVLATLHTNDSASTPMRLVEMGLEPYLVTSAVTGALAQRLARQLCVHCKEEYEPTEADIVAAGWRTEEVFSGKDHPTLFRAVGCPVCSKTGYRGRKALIEFLVVSDDVERLIIEGGTADDIHKLAVEQGMVTLRQSGLRKALEGDTTLEEVLRVVA